MPESATSPLHVIPFEEAIEMTTLYRQEKENILMEEYRNTGILPLCETFGKESVLNLMAQTGCESIRIYYGMKEDLSVHAILVGVNGNDEDMLPTELLETPRQPADNNGELLEDANRCPTDCPPASPLNE